MTIWAHKELELSFRKARFCSRSVRVLWWFIPEHTHSWLSSNFFLCRRFKRWTLVTHHSTLLRFLSRNRKPPSRRSLFLAEEDKHFPQGGWQLFCFHCTTRYYSFVDLAIFTLHVISLARCFPKLLSGAFNNGTVLKSATLYQLFNVFCLPLKSMQFFVSWANSEYEQSISRKIFTARLKTGCNTWLSCAKAGQLYPAHKSLSSG